MISTAISLEPGAAALLQELRAQAIVCGHDLEFRNAAAKTAQLLEVYACPTETGCLKQAEHQVGMLEQIGRAAALQLREFQAILGFVAHAHEHKMRVVAPLVEDARTAAGLWSAGIDYIQGNFVQQAGQDLDFEFRTAST